MEMVYTYTVVYSRHWSCIAIEQPNMASKTEKFYFSPGLLRYNWQIILSVWFSLIVEPLYWIFELSVLFCCMMSVGYFQIFSISVVNCLCFYAVLVILWAPLWPLSWILCLVNCLSPFHCVGLWSSVLFATYSPGYSFYLSFCVGFYELDKRANLSALTEWPYIAD